MSKVADIAREYLKKYTVEDVINKRSTILFILESPHTQEMKYGYPVAGGSGVEMTKFIYGNQFQDAFGKIVSQSENYQDKYDNLERFSILNVSPAPMQEGGLRAYDLNSEAKEVVAILEKLRVNYKSKKHNNKDWNRVKSIILDDFKDRLVTTLENYPQITYLVPCGRFAASYLELIKDTEEIIIEKEIVTEIPHPSFNQWRKYDLMKKLRKIL